MSTLYFPFLLFPHTPTKTPPPILLLKMRSEQVALALSDVKAFRKIFNERGGNEQAVWLLLRLGACEMSSYNTYFPHISPEVAEKFTALVNRAPKEVVKLFEIDISTQPFPARRTA